jgi:ketosteroid isomerase-like protein
LGRLPICLRQRHSRTGAADEEDVRYPECFGNLFEAPVRLRPGGVRRAVVGAAAEAARADGSSAAKAAITERLNRSTAAFNAKEPTAICNLFAPDLRYTLDDILNGSRDQLCGNIDKVLATPGLTLRYAEPSIHEMLVSGDLAVVRLTWTLTAETTRRDVTTDDGMDVLRRTPDGVWSTARYIAFSTRPNAALKGVVPTP